MSIDGPATFFYTPRAVKIANKRCRKCGLVASQPAECRLSHAAAVNFDFISDITDDERTESSGSLTGWENVVFELEDEPPVYPEARSAEGSPVA